MMSRNNDSEIERRTKPTTDPAARKGPGKANKRRVVVVRRPKIVVSRSISGRPRQSAADETKSKRSGSKIQRKKATSQRLVRRTKSGKGNRRRRRRQPKSREGGLKVEDEEEDLKETGVGCYCSQLREGLREEGEARRGNLPGGDGSKCWVCRLRDMGRKCKQLRG